MEIVSIIMPVYNVERHLPRAIESALQQTSSEWELILVNDGSTDESGNICEAYKEKDERIHVIHQENQGSGPARNAGLVKARGEYIYFADPDDYFDADLIEDNLAIMKKDQADLVVFGYVNELMDQSGKVHQDHYLPNMPRLKTQEEFRAHFQNFYLFSPYALWNKVYRKAYLIEQQIRFTNQRLGQDALFNLSVYKEMGRVFFNRKVYYHYMTHEGSAVNRYRADRMEMEYEIAKTFEHLLVSWNKAEQFKDLITEEYFHVIYLETANLAHRDCPLTRSEKIERLQSIWNEVGITKGVSSKKEAHPFRFLLMQAFKRKKFNAALMLMKSRNGIADNYTFLFKKIRQSVRKK
ncbi:glycosyltransferase [Atopococcus tabaci]|uniref:glycosyltransferase n=1 Tax=Atopococcus tabaci TaxID=269774 RepID=UPI0003FFFCB3|nr:glycosyltransferase [Atopococcus tabaci]